MTTTTKSIRQDYTSGAASLEPFYNYPIANLDFEQAIQDKSREKIDRKVLQQVLSAQYEGFPASEATRINIASLSSVNTFTITTGHQLVMFGGPLYTIYKVLSTIRLAKELSEKHPEQHFVPVFWIHTEDHDFEEINHYYKGYGQKVSYPSSFQSKVGDHILTDKILDLIPDHFPADLKACYQPGLTLADGYRRFMFKLFDEYGLLILDADHPALKASFRRVVTEDILESASYVEVSRTSHQLEEAGYPLQIMPREINLFYLDQQGRDRIVANNGHYEVMQRNLQFQIDEIRQLIQNSPEKFSPNVSLRPLYQEMILPNLAYFGGWAEVSYWLQLKGVFDHFGVNFPFVLPRMSATIFKAEQLENWNKLGFSQEDIQQDTPSLYRQYLPKIWDDSNFTQYEFQIGKILQDFQQYISSEISTTLARSAKALAVKNAKYLGNMRKKAEKVIRSNNPAIFDEISSLKSNIQPDGSVQERVLSVAAFPEYDPREIVKQVWDHFDSYTWNHQYICLQKI